jgi:acyl-CoA thioester hydrolase
MGTGDVRVRVWVEKLGRTSLTFGLRVMPLDQDIDYATGQRVIVRVDPQSKQPVPWSDAFAQSIEPYCRDMGPRGDSATR